MKTNSLKTPLLAFFTGLLLLAALCYSFMPSASYTAAIEKRAKVIFMKDEQKLAKYPSNRVYALSLALGFKNYQGAEAILNQLE